MKFEQPFCVFVVAFAVVIAGWSSQAIADVALLANGERVYGKVTQRDNANVTLATPDGERVLLRAEILELVISIDEARLEKLHPNKYQNYLEYAEELAAAQEDSAARELAIRLLLIGAYSARANSDVVFVESALNNLVPLARSDEERLRFQMLQQLFSRHPDQGWKSLQSAVVKEKSYDPTVRRKLASAVKALRQENTDEARKLLADSSVSEELSRWSSYVSKQELLSALADRQDLKSSLGRLLALELALHDSSRTPSQDVEPAGGFRQRPKKSKTWFEQSTQYLSSPLSIPSLETVTEFDPRDSVYRNATWQKPD